ncbi:MAG TPA: transposase [Casimicrobiaceae bacterium]|nr:transposase [Casimicrobiaceae bacterium]
MPRRPRFSVTDLPIHVIQRGNDRKRCFFCERDFRLYLDTLGEVSLRYGVRVHAYVLMTNHVHLLVTPTAPHGVSRLMHALGTRYVKRVNAAHQRTGTLWEGRYKACLVARDEHVLAACRYIDLNPVRAGMVQHPGDYRWSSYTALALMRDDHLVHRHGVLEQLGSPPGPAYARWCAAGIHENELQRIREATNQELAFGSDEFRGDIEAKTARPTFTRPRGRPPSRH